MKKIKKWLVIMLSAVMAFATFGLVSCGDSTENSSSLDSISSETDNSSSEGNSVDPEELGTFYTLQEAYEIGDITFEDLLNIAYYSGNEVYNTDTFKDFEPKKKQELNEEVALVLKFALAEEHNKNVKDEEKKINVDGFIISYYGCYNELHAFEDSHMDILESEVITEEWETIDGICFKYTSSSRIKLWKR
ncbi:MAG: hypothetical protein IJV83_04130 [Clostridia bacterium]|nr:hypothetical protein [Clostridia bacterium]